MHSQLSKPLLGAAQVMVDAGRLGQTRNGDIEAMADRFVDKMGVSRRLSINGLVGFDAEIVHRLGVSVKLAPASRPERDYLAVRYVESRLMDVIISPHPSSVPANRVRICEGLAVVPFGAMGFVQIVGSAEFDFSKQSGEFRSATRRFAAALLMPRGEFSRVSCGRSDEAVALCFGATVGLVEVRRKMLSCLN